MLQAEAPALKRHKVETARIEAINHARGSIFVTSKAPLIAAI
jgi:hypothetical protein